MKPHIPGDREEGQWTLNEIEQVKMADGEQWYHMANIHALLGDRDGCVRARRNAVDGGFFNYPFMERDSFLDSSPRRS